MIGRIRYKVAGYQCVSEWPSVISHISRYEPRGASGTATATLIFASPRARYYQFPLRFSTTSSKSFVHLSVSSSERIGSVCTIFTFLSGEGAFVFEGT